MAKSGMRVSEAGPAARGPGRGEPAAQTTFLLSRPFLFTVSQRALHSNPACAALVCPRAPGWCRRRVVTVRSRVTQVMLKLPPRIAGDLESVIAAFDDTSSGPRAPHTHTHLCRCGLSYPVRFLFFFNSGEIQRGFFLIRYDERTDGVWA